MMTTTAVWRSLVPFSPCCHRSALNGVTADQISSLSPANPAAPEPAAEDIPVEKSLLVGVVPPSEAPKPEASKQPQVPAELLEAAATARANMTKRQEARAAWELEKKAVTEGTAVSPTSGEARAASKKTLEEVSSGSGGGAEEAKPATTGGPGETAAAEADPPFPVLFARLPAPLIKGKLLPHLPAPALCLAQQCSQVWRHIGSGELLWRNLYLNVHGWPHPTAPSHPGGDPQDPPSWSDAFREQWRRASRWRGDWKSVLEQQEVTEGTGPGGTGKKLLVSPDGAGGGHAFLSDAIAAAENGDTIYVAGGVYEETAGVVKISKSVEVVGLVGPQMEDTEDPVITARFEIDAAVGRFKNLTIRPPPHESQLECLSIQGASRWQLEGCDISGAVRIGGRSEPELLLCPYMVITAL